MKYAQYSWVLPFLVLLGIYGSEALSFLMGNPEHYQILSGLGFGGRITLALAWASVIIEAAIIAGVIWKPSIFTFSIAALWPWVPRVISALTGAMLEMDDLAISSAASVAALLACLLYERSAALRRNGGKEA